MMTREIRLKSLNHYGHRAPAKDTGSLLHALPEAVTLSVRMAIEGRSQGQRRPRWLQEAGDLRLVAIGGDDETILTFELPTLREAAPEVFTNRPLFDSLEDSESRIRQDQLGADTGIDLLADVFSDISKRNEDSDRFDTKLLEYVCKFRKFFGDTFSGFEFDRRGLGAPVAFTRTVFEQARQLYSNVPVPKRVRIVGRLETLRVSTQTFGVILDDGQEVRGVLVEGEIEALTGLMKQRVQIHGQAIYRPSGRLLRLDAEELSLTTDNGSFFSAIPKPTLNRFEMQEVLREQSEKAGIGGIIGKWPGDETDEEIAAALAEIS